MLVAGLLSPATPPPPPPQQQQQQSRQAAGSSANGALPSGAAEAISVSDSTAAQSSQSTSPAAAPSSPPLQQTSASTASPAVASTSRAPAPSEAFPSLTKDLCDIFIARGRNSAWDPARGQSAAFHTVLVERTVRLPPRKTRPTTRSLTAATPEEHSSLASLQPRSPLSPLHPSSPLFPDGLIAPIWLRKHRELVPAVYVAFFCLAEPKPPETGAIGSDGSTEGVGPASTSAPSTTGQELKARDEELIKTISDRKRMLSERGIKFTVVLLTTREMLESSALESRLSYIRRSSQLDSRASLFVLTPVSKAELGEFVTSLQSALYDAALDYYREHFRRVRRKRTRYPPAPAVVSQVMSAASEARGSPIKDAPLSREGWLARNSYKLGTFAEMGGNFDEALAHYASAYHALAFELLPSTLLLPPRTRRWAEAKVLADTLSFRLSKLHLYRGDSDSAWSQFRAHVKRFIEMSQGWGIGETTFEFWSWLGKQYRLMGDLLDLATRDAPGAPLPAFRPSIHFPPLPTFLLHPSHLPTPTASGNVVASYNPQHGNLAVPNDAAVASQCIPATLCPSSGECFYMAGICALERWQRYKRMVWEEERNATTNSAEQAPDTWTSASLVQERKVDHSAQAIDALTRAHEVSKRQRRHRFSLFVASKIVYAYLEAEQYELALRFLERIVKTYQHELWTGPFVSQLLLALASTERIADRERQLRTLWALAGAQSLLDQGRAQAAVQQLRQCIKGEAVAPHKGKEPVLIQFEDGNCAFLVECVFARMEGNFDGRPIPFQVRLSLTPHSSLAGIDFDMLRIRFAEDMPDLSVIAKKNGQQQSSITSIGIFRPSKTDGKSLEMGFADLTWAEGATRALQGAIVPHKPGYLQVSGVTLEKHGSAPFNLELDISAPEESSSSAQPRWLVSAHPVVRYVSLPHREDPRGVLIKQRQHKVRLEIVHDDEAYVHERFPIRIKVTNEDSTSLSCALDVHVANGVADLSPGGQLQETASAPSNLLQNHQLGVIGVGSAVELGLDLQFAEPAARGVAEVVIHSIEPDYSGLAPDDQTAGSSSLSTVVVPVKSLFTAAFSAQWRMLRAPLSHASLGATTIDDDASSSSSAMTAADSQAPSMSVAEGNAQSSALASVNVALTVHANRDISIRCIRAVLEPKSKHLRLIAAGNNPMAALEGVASQTHETEVAGTWAHADRWGGAYDIELLGEGVAGVAVEDEDGSIRLTGHLDIEWRRYMDEDRRNKEADGTAVRWNMARVALPLLVPPSLLSRLVVSVPTSVYSEQPFVMLFTIVNPSRLPSDVLIAVDDSQADVVVLQQHKTFTVPNLLPRSTRSIAVNVAARHRGGNVPSNDASREAASQPGRGGFRVLPRLRAWQRDRRDTALQQQREGHAPTQASAITELGPAAGAGGPLATKDDNDDRSAAASLPAPPPIVNARPGVGVPLDIALRYTAAKNMASGGGGVGGGGGLDDGAGQSHGHGHGSAQTSHDLPARLHAESQRSGMWHIVVQT